MIVITLKRAKFLFLTYLISITLSVIQQSFNKNHKNKPKFTSDIIVLILNYKDSNKLISEPLFKYLMLFKFSSLLFSLYTKSPETLKMKKFFIMAKLI
jgi:hypothetical protein